MKEKVLFEVCCGCFEDAVQAEKGGADRIELNSALFLGGLTPSIGTVQAVKNTLKIPVMCMGAPRARAAFATRISITRPAAAIWKHC